MNFLKIKLLHFLMLLFVISNIVNAADDPICSDGIITDLNECQTQPDEHHVYFYRVAVCLNEPTAPSGSSSYDASEVRGCKTIFESQNPNGSDISIQKDINNIPTDGKFYRPESGNYKFGFIEIAPIIKVKKKATFNRVMTASDGSTGRNCWSLGVAEFNYTASSLQMASCSNSQPSSSAVGVTVVNMNSFFDNNVRVYSVSGRSSKDGGTITAYLVDSDGKLATSTPDHWGTVNRLIATIPLSYKSQEALKKSKTVSQIKILFNNSMGTTLSINSNGNPDFIYDFNSGPFDFSFETTKVEND